MRVCQLFSMAAVALSFLVMTGCSTPSTLKATGVSGQASPLHQAMQQAADAGFAKRAH